MARGGLGWGDLWGDGIPWLGSSAPRAFEGNASQQPSLNDLAKRLLHDSGSSPEVQSFVLNASSIKSLARLF